VNVFTLTFSQGSTAHRKLSSEFHTRQLLTCGRLDV